MKDSGERGFVQAYNAQIAVDSQAQIIVAAELTAATHRSAATVTYGESRKKHSTRSANNYHRRRRLLGHDQPSGSGGERHREMLVAPDAKPHLPGRPLPPNAPRSQEAFRMREALATAEGKARYACLRTDNSGTGIRPDQRSTWYPQIPLTWPVERDIRVEAHLRYPQSSQTISPSNDFGSRLTIFPKLPRFRIT